MKDWQREELGSGEISDSPHNGYNLSISPQDTPRYSNAQIDDYNGRRRKAYLWQPGTMLSLEARFSHSQDQLIGTAGFGFWNAPFGDPKIIYPTLPQATWFFFASPPNDLPLSKESPGRGWFASTLDATTWQALSLSPLALPTILLNRWPWFKHRIWPKIQQTLNMSFQPLDHLDITVWHKYELLWQPSGCKFFVDGQEQLQTNQTCRGPLGFVCWIDNQYMVCTPTGRLGAGILSIQKKQWLNIRNLSIQKHFI